MEVLGALERVLEAFWSSKIHRTRAVRAVRGAVAEVQRPLQEGVLSDYEDIKDIIRKKGKERRLE